MSDPIYQENLKPSWPLVSPPQAPETFPEAVSALRGLISDSHFLIKGSEGADAKVIKKS
jgi:hypothetical protein